jgi:DSF synthase
VVLASDAPVFNLGGDLDLFARLIRARDRQHLMAYARSCVEGVYAFHAGLDVGLHSVALVQGDALGGGFEAALSCNTIVAETGVGMGLPEVLFDLFPGMGAYSFLSRRVGPTQAERMMLSGNIYSSEELYKLGVVDVLAPKGEGAAAVEDVIRRNRRIPHARRAMQRVAQVGGSPITLDELMRITEIWVDTAMRLGEKSLRTMERLVRAQTKRANGEAGDEAAPADEALVAERLVARNS